MGDVAMKTDTLKGSTKKYTQSFKLNHPILWWEYRMWQSNAMVLCKYLYQVTWAELIKTPDALNFRDRQRC